jgi:hypothetical protein
MAHAGLTIPRGVFRSLRIGFPERPTIQGFIPCAFVSAVPGAVQVIGRFNFAMHPIRVATDR